MEGSKEEIKNVNLVIKNQEEEDDNRIIISFSGIINNLKRFVALWVAVSIVVSILTLLISTLVNIKVYKETKALVSFTYNGIEKGLDPNGNKFDVNTIKSPNIISKAIDELGYDEEAVEAIRKSISIEGIVPQNVMDKITAYKEIVETGTNASLTAVEKILDTSYYPTQYIVKFNYADTSLKGSEASAILNKMLECYSEYFLDKYGYNEALGAAVTSIDYTEYDYAEALDVFDSTLSSLKSYVDQLNKSDTVRFRSSETGYSFADLSKAIATIQDVDMDMISSYITLNVVTKDKESLETYYQYRIESLQRHEVVCRENLSAVTESINNYEKNTVQIFGAGTDNINTTAKEASKQYDDLFDRKLSVQNDLSSTVQRINLYKLRLERLNDSVVSNSKHIEKTEADLAKLDLKIKNLIEKVSISSDEYYKTVVFAKSYNILVPASTSAVSFVKSALKDSILVTLVIDVLIFVVYFSYCVIASVVSETKKRKVNESKEIVKAATEKANK